MGEGGDFPLLRVVLLAVKTGLYVTAPYVCSALYFVFIRLDILLHTARYFVSTRLDILFSVDNGITIGIGMELLSNRQRN